MFQPINNQYKKLFQKKKKRKKESQKGSDVQAVTEGRMTDWKRCTKLIFAGFFSFFEQDATPICQLRLTPQVSKKKRYLLQLIKSFLL